MNIEKVILAHLLYHPQFCQTTLPFLKTSYFRDPAEAVIFDKISEFINEYHLAPTREVIAIALQDDTKLNEGVYGEALECLDDLEKGDEHYDWILNRTEKFCRERAVSLAIMESIAIQNGESKQSIESIPTLLQDALSVGFDMSVGHDYFEDAETRFQAYIEDEERIPFDIEVLNTITRGGAARKTLNVVMAGTGIGKTIFMCHNAASFMSAGYNVLYITLEMEEVRIAERIDANLLGINIDDIASISPESFKKRVAFIKEKTPGRLIIKEYPTSSANANNFRALLKELSIKKRFKPDVIFIDYLNLCQSVRYPKSDNGFQVVKAIAEEIRGLGMEYDASIWSATQLNREGFGSSDADLTHVAESFGVPQTADLFLLLMVDEQLDAAGQVLFKQLKNRYRDLNKDRRFLVGLNKDRMTFHNLDMEEQAKVTAIAKKTDPDPATPTTKAFFTKDTKFKKKELFETDEDL